VALFKHVEHPHIRRRREHGPVKTADQAGTGFNTWLATKVTAGVGTMWCAYAFGLFDCLALPTAIHGGTYGVVQWVASFFLQLVLLSVIMVGQNLAAAASDGRAEQTYDDAEAVLHEALQIQAHLAAQDKAIERILDHLALEGSEENT
jgi:hypothetical protein